MTGFVLTISILSLLIILHELSHLAVARLFGFQTPVFGLGLPYGPSTVLGKFGGTEVRLHLLCFGSYVTIPELDPETVDGPALEKPFRTFAIWKRMTVVFAGLLFYLVFSWTSLFFSESVWGEPVKEVYVQGLAVHNPIAAQAGVQIHDRILAVDKNPVYDAPQVATYLLAHPKTEVVLRVLRQDEQLDLPVISNQDGRIGVMLDVVQTTKYRRLNLQTALALTTQKYANLNAIIFSSSGILSRGITGLSTRAGSGGRHHFIFAISAFVEKIFKQDPRQLFTYISLISMDLAILGLIPWPGTDGSHLLGLLFNAGRGKVARLPRPAFFAYISLLFLYIGNGLPACMLRGNSKSAKK